MNITILANKDLASNLALNYLVSGLAEHELTIFLSDMVGNSTNQPAALQDLKFFEQQLFNEIVFPTIDANGSEFCDSKGEQLTPQPTFLTFNNLQTIIGSPITSLNNVNEPAGLTRLRASQPDLLLSIRFGKILQQEAIGIPQLGVVNLHSGQLPKYQGVMATFWAMYNEEKNYGTTLHFIDSAGIDVGPIISTTRRRLKLSESYLSNTLALYEDGCNSRVQAVQKLATGEALKRAPQQGRAQYFSFPDTRQLDDFFSRGMRLFDSQQVLQIAKSYQFN